MKYPNLGEMLKIAGQDSDAGITFINDLDEEISISYKALYDYALELLYCFQKKGINADDKLILQVVDHQLFITSYWACILGGIIPVPIIISNDKENVERLLKIYKVLGESYIFAEKSLLPDEALKILEGQKILEKNIIIAEELTQHKEKHGQVVQRHQDDIAFIQFSSGSTGEPKGVSLTHGNIIANTQSIAKQAHITKEDSCLSWIPLTHDMGLIGCHMTLVCVGCSQWIMPTQLFIKSPVTWIKKINAHQITISAAPNFGFKYFVNNFKLEDAKTWDLSCLRVIFNGAEPIVPDVINQFLNVLEPYGLSREVIYPAYGIAEATLAVTAPRHNEPLTLVSLDRETLNVGSKVKELQSVEDPVSALQFADLGYPLDGFEIRICNKQEEELADYTVGFIEIKGKSICKGYFNNQQATKDLFTPDGWLKTGDLGYLREGRLIITGRAKEIIIINGQNYYPYDIEAIIQRTMHNQVKEVVAFGVRDAMKQAEKAVIAIVPHEQIDDESKLIEAVKRTVYKAMQLEISDVMIKQQIPKTTSGKVQRFKLAQLYKSKLEMQESTHKGKDINSDLYTNKKKGLVLQNQLLNLCKEILHIEDITVNDNFLDWHISSIQLLNLTQKLNEMYAIHVTVTDLFAYPSILQLSEYLLNKTCEATNKENIEEENESDEIAIIGMAIQGPMANDIDTFWDNLVAQKDCITELPSSRRKDIESYFRYTGQQTDHISYLKGGYLEEVDKFDYELFNISAKEASLMNPHQRLLLQTTWQALEDAGYSQNKLKSSQTGVYVGYIGDTEGYKYRKMICDYDPTLESVALTGNLPSIIPSRISYWLDLKGPTLLVDTACSSSLVAVHLACQGILKGDCDMAIAGGVKVNLFPIESESKLGMESSDGKARTFDDAADGTGIGEGVGAVVLKPLKKALKDGDLIYAVIKGSAMNQDGKSAGITAPNTLAQTEVIQKAWEAAHINPETISYIEAHGTGTKLGDVIEIEGITKAFAQYTNRKQFCAISSLKTNIGHLFEAAGIFSLIKAALALKHKQIPGQINFNRPNHRINFENSPVYVNTILQPWESHDTPRRCGISAFGFSGTNCHMILEEAPNEVKLPALELEKRQYLLTLSARSKETLKQLVGMYQKYMKQDVAIESICCTSQIGRSHYPHRLAICVADKDELKRVLEKLNNQFESVADLNQCYYQENQEDISREEQLTLEEDRLRLDAAAYNLISNTVAAQRVTKVFMSKLAELYVQGANIEWEALYTTGNKQKVHIPLTPLNKKRCWVESPNEKLQKDYFYELQPQLEPLQHKEEIAYNNAIAIIANDIAQAEKITEKLRQEKHQVLIVTRADKFECINEMQCTVGDQLEDYVLLTQYLNARKIKQIMHISTLNTRPIETVNQLYQSQEEGLYSLYHLMRAYAQNEEQDKVTMFIVTEGTKVITGNEEIKPEHATLVALAKVIKREYTLLDTRVMDIDSEVTVNQIYEAFRWQTEECSYYRGDKRYLDYLHKVTLDEKEDENIAILPHNVYLITGGLGGIGYSIAQYLVSKNSIRLVLINRTPLPDECEWDTILSSNSNPGLIKRINNIRALKAKGAEVLCLSVDVSNLEQMQNAIDKVKQRFGKINGVIHCAGIASDGYIIDKSEDEFKKVITPKVYGTWILNKVTENQKLDFFVVCSSIASLLTSARQGDYSAANAYLDAFSIGREKEGKKTLAVNWAAWKETGMAVANDINIDMIFKAIKTDEALKRLEELLSKKLAVCSIAELNFESAMVDLLEKCAFKLSKQLQHKLHIEKEKRELQVGYSDTQKKISEICEQVLGVEAIKANESFFDMGIDSIMIPTLSQKLNETFEKEITVQKLFAYPTVASLANYLDEESKTLKVVNKPLTESSRHDIAVIGLALKVPGANDKETFWKNLKEEKCEIQDIPDIRKTDCDNYRLYTNKADSNYIKAGYLDEIDKFDYKLFKVTPKEASLMDPNQRLFLQTAWETIEDAGYGGERIKGSNTGVYLGFSADSLESYGQMVANVDSEFINLSVTGNLSAVMPSRISYILNLKGPSMVINTACSSSLVAVHLACEALRRGDCEMALAGGIRLNLMPIEEGIKLGIESSDNKTKSFDDAADGTVSGEGVGAIMLKPLEQALADGDHIYSVIKGSAINQDGTSASITAPNAAAQENVLVSAWEDAQIDPSTISYIETHGTGTPLGDPIEIEGISEAFKRYTDRKQFCAIGAVKTNIGHLYEASGIISFIKATLCLYYKKLIPVLHFNKPNHLINFEDSPAYINTQLKVWEQSNEARRCGVSAFGFSGTNCHVVLEEAPALRQVQELENQEELFVISAKSEDNLLQLINRYNEMELNEINLSDLCYTASTGREHYEYRLAMLISTIDEWKEKLEEAIKVIKQGYESDKVFYGVSMQQEEEALSQEAYEQMKYYKTTEGNDKQILSKIAQLYTKGARINWQELNKGEGRRKVSLPTYPFEKNRCWINLPQSSCAINRHFYYKLGFKEQLIACDQVVNSDKVIAVLTTNTSRENELINNLKENGYLVTRVQLADSYEKMDEYNYCIGDNYADYNKLIRQLKAQNVKQYMHIATLQNTQIKKLEDLRESQRKGLYSLYYLTHAFYENKIKDKLGLFIVTEGASEILSDDQLKPENNTMITLGKAIVKEFPNLEIRCMDIDDQVESPSILEAFRYQKEYRTSYRKQHRYIEELQNEEVTSNENDKIIIKNEGVYIITGGLGGIGLTLAQYFATQAHIKLVLINRTSMPARHEWDAILKCEAHNPMCNKIQAIRDIEAQGSEVICMSADTSNFEEMREVIESVKARYKKIDGIVHCAGIAGDGYIVRKDEETLSKVIAPKIYGSWILDTLTKDDALDFYIICSSIASVLAFAGQGDYAAANAYIDTFAQRRNKAGKRTLALNWTAWKEIGMAFNYQANEDTIFKAITTKDAVKAFEKLMESQITNCIIGELNIGSKYMNMLNEFSFEISPSIKDSLKNEPKLYGSIRNGKDIVKLLESYIVKNDLPTDLNEDMKTLIDQLSETIEKCEESISANKVNVESKENVKLSGRVNNEYTEIETQVAQVWKEILGIEEFSIYDNYFDLGGDSITAIQIVGRLKKDGIDLDINDILQYQTIEKLAQYIAEISAAKEEHMCVAIRPIQRLLLSNTLENTIDLHPRAQIHMQNGFKMDLVKEVIYKLVEANAIFKTVINEEGMQYVPNNQLENIDFKVINTEITADVEAERESLLSEMISQYSTIEMPFIQVVCFKTSGGDYLNIIMNRLICNMSSLERFISKFIEGYSKLQKEGILSISQQDNPFESWYMPLENRIKIIDFNREKSYWDTIAKQYDAIEEASENESNTYNKFTLTIDSVQKHRFLDNIKEIYNINAKEAILIVLGDAIRESLGKEQMLIHVIEDGCHQKISDLDQEKLIGQFEYTYPVVLNLAQTDCLAEYIKNTKESLMQIPNSGLGFEFIQYLDNAISYPNLLLAHGITYSYRESQVYGKSNYDHDEDVMFKLESNSVYKNDLQISVVLAKESIELEFRYNEYSYSNSSIKELIEHFRKSINYFIQHCEMKEEKEITPSDYGCEDLSGEEVEDILSLFE